jgi:hypothetical protein
VRLLARAWRVPDWRLLTGLGGGRRLWLGWVFFMKKKSAWPREERSAGGGSEIAQVRTVDVPEIVLDGEPQWQSGARGMSGLHVKRPDAKPGRKVVSPMGKMVVRPRRSGQKPRLQRIGRDGPAAIGASARSFQENALARIIQTPLVRVAGQDAVAPESGPSPGSYAR